MERWQQTGRKGWEGGVPEGTPGSHSGGVEILPDKLWKPGGAEFLDTTQVHMTAQTFFKGLWGLEGRGGGRGRARRPPGGPHHFPHSRQLSVAPEPGRKQEVGNSRGRGERLGCRIGWRGAQRRARSQKDPLIDGAIERPRLFPQSGTHTPLGPKTGLGERPSRSHQAKDRSRKGRRGGVVWAPGPPPPATGGSCCPQGPAAQEPVGAGEYVGRT